MSYRILVAYASGTGSTAEVAEAIAQILRGPDIEVDTKSVTAVAGLASYNAVVLGSSIRAGRWLPAAVQFLMQHRLQMADMPVAYFTTCLTMVNDNADNRRTVLSYIEPIRQMAPEIDPLGIGLFAGSLAPDLEQILPGESGLYGDYRDWEAIEAWSKEIKPLLLNTAVGKATSLVLSQSQLSYTDMSGLNLSHINLAQSQLRKTNLREANLQGAKLLQSELIGADLQQADLHQAELGWANLSNSNLRQADFTLANLIGAQLTGANLSGANLSQTILNGANLTKANLTQTILTGADMNWTNLQQADLTGADLRNANLSWADFSGAILSNADLQQAVYNTQTKWPAGFSAKKAGCILIPRPH